MQIEVLKSKIHRAKVTGVDLDYIGSITIDEALLEAAGMIEDEKVSIINVNNGECLDTHIIKGERHSGVIVLNRPVVRKVQRGDMITIISYTLTDFEEVKAFKLSVISPSKQANLLE